MKKLLFIALLISVMFGCKNGTKEADKNAENENKYASFIAKEAIPAGGYVYVLGEQADSSKWFAINSQEITIGDKYYFTDPLVMKNFYSKELNRPFDEVSFLMLVSTNPADLDQPEEVAANKPSGKITTVKEELSINVPENGITIAQLFENSKQYAGKKVIIRGKVIKFSSEIGIDS